ncbi:hypothetical protein FQN51_006471 [Onygenales sp. PD_10]|nr:hypothetical protein FQN51_006471 [Onygenales sp. PD_10]
MLSITHPSVKGDNDSATDGKFQFISVCNPGDAKDEQVRRRARSHAVKRALERKRKLQQESRDNFCVSTLKDYPGSLAKRKSSPAHTLVTPSPFSLSVGVLDPFRTLAVDSPRLQALLTDYKFRQAAEPVFSVADELAFQNFHAVFQTGLDDPALLNAVMLTFTVAVTQGSIDRESLGYQSQAISYIRQRMSSLVSATSISTIGAILLLAGVEARLGAKSQVQLHMKAISQLLDICRSEGIYLTDGIKRAVFWQDLNCSIMTGSSRIVDHTTFAELHWRRDPFTPSFYRLPPGFQARSHLLSTHFMEVLEDIHAFQCIRDLANLTRCDILLRGYLNNHQASIQSRLSQVSLQLLRKLQQADDDPIWDDHADLLLWLLYIGGAFALTGAVRSNYISLLHWNYASRFQGLYNSWPELLGILRHFIWSDDAFMSPVKALWEEISI